MPNAVYPSLEQVLKKQEVIMKKIPLSFVSHDDEKDSHLMWTETFLIVCFSKIISLHVH